MSNIEEDIKELKELNNLLKFFKTHGWIPNLSREINTNGIIDAIENILAEREEDKKRIEELEDENRGQRHQIMEVFDRGYIHKDKVKEELERAEKENEPYEKYNKESRAYWINQGRISLAKKLSEDK